MFIIPAGREPRTKIETLRAVAEWVNTRAKTSTRSNDTQTYIQNINAGTRTHPHICIPALMLTHSNTPAHIICTGRGTASAGVKQWTAFEPLTSVTHPYWWQAAHSLTTQRFSKHSMAPGTLGVNGGREAWMDGWMAEFTDKSNTLPVKFICQGVMVE